MSLPIRFALDGNGEAEGEHPDERETDGEAEGL